MPLPTFHTYHCILLLSLAVLGGCTSVIRNPVPEALYEQASVLGRDDLRYWGDAAPPAEWAIFEDSHSTELEQRYPAITHTEHNYLAISGGGANGAYGAGLLSGWSATGTRPEFTLVTGISTGALTAPFAFLGTDYDQQLQEVYTTLDTSRIFNRRKLISVIGNDSVVDATPLVNTIEKYLTDELIEELAAQYRTGRNLHIGTSNLDAGRPVVWNIGRIANSGHPDAPDLIRRILRASASIPGVFPPVYIQVQGADGKTYDEMHVDGGTSSQMFLYPGRFDWTKLQKALNVKGKPTAYLIRNSFLQPEYEAVSPRLLPIVGKSVASLIRTQGIGDAYRIYVIARRDGIDVQATWIPRDSIMVTSEEAFDPAYMSVLFEYGYQRATTGDAWVDIGEEIEERYQQSRGKAGEATSSR